MAVRTEGVCDLKVTRHYDAQSMLSQKREGNCAFTRSGVLRFEYELAVISSVLNI